MAGASNGGMLDGSQSLGGLPSDFTGAGPSGHPGVPQHPAPVPFPGLHELLMPPPHIEVSPVRTFLWLPVPRGKMGFDHLQICKTLFAPDTFEQTTLQNILKIHA